MKFIVTGKKHWIGGQQVSPGTVVELTEQQARAFADRVQPAPEPEQPPKAQPVQSAKSPAKAEEPAKSPVKTEAPKASEAK